VTLSFVARPGPIVNLVADQQLVDYV
jgi:hypothetical protein